MSAHEVEFTVSASEGSAKELSEAQRDLLAESQTHREVHTVMQPGFFGYGASSHENIKEDSIKTELETQFTETIKHTSKKDIQLKITYAPKNNEMYWTWKIIANLDEKKSDRGCPETVVVTPKKKGSNQPYLVGPDESGVRPRCFAGKCVTIKTCQTCYQGFALPRPKVQLTMDEVGQKVKDYLAWCSKWPMFCDCGEDPTCKNDPKMMVLIAEFKNAPN